MKQTEWVHDGVTLCLRRYVLNHGKIGLYYNCDFNKGKSVQRDASLNNLDRICEHVVTQFRRRKKKYESL